MAQEARKRPIPEVSRKLLGVGGKTKHLTLDHARCLSVYACKVMKVFGLLGSCIVESLVASTLMRDRKGICLHIGFRPNREGEETRVQGHAWVSCAGRNITDPTSDKLDDEPGFTESTRITIS